jgi:hypothetical protein
MRWTAGIDLLTESSRPFRHSFQFRVLKEMKRETTNWNLRSDSQKSVPAPPQIQIDLGLQDKELERGIVRTYPRGYAAAFGRTARVRIFVLHGLRSGQVTRRA